jgi:hypothetical protein
MWCSGKRRESKYDSEGYEFIMEGLQHNMFPNTESGDGFHCISQNPAEYKSEPDSSTPLL